jgi:hypothetical protein
MARGRWHPPTLVHSEVYGGLEFIIGAVPSLTPETYDPALATEEHEQAQANARAIEGIMEIDALEEQFKLELEEEI